jgi:hypothetical protein
MTREPVVHIGKIVRNAMVFNAHRWKEAPVVMDEILQTVNNLFALLHQRKMKYVLVGGIALLQYVQGRNTEDIDFILNVSALQKLPEITLTSQDTYFARGTYQGLQIDFLFTKNPFFAHVQKQHVTQQPFFERTIISATIRGLVLLKLYALPSLYRQGDFVRVGLYENDVATLLFYHTLDMKEVIIELTPFVSAHDLAAIHDILSDIEHRISRFKRTNDNV